MAGPRIGIFWFRRRPNFGDALAPLLARQFAGLDTYWAPPPNSDAVVVGSIAGHVGRGYRGVVVGIGRIEETIRLDLSAARVLGLRGELTLKESGVSGEVVLGDSGLLVRELFGAEPHPQHPLGVVAHLNDGSLRGRYPEALHIDVGSDPADFVRLVASCERIVSSSLHGLITADSLGLPRLWAMTPGARGGGFKFRDYSTALGIAISPEQWITAPAAHVERVQSRLRDVFAEIPRVLPPDRPGQPNWVRRVVHNAAWRLSPRS
jgi:pyruvyltransferase